MDEKTKKLVRQLSKHLLCFDHDISEDSYFYLRQLLELTGDVNFINHVKATDGRFYLPPEFDNIIIE